MKTLPINFLPTHFDRNDFGIVLHDTGGTIEPFISMNGNLEFANVVFVDFFSNAWFEEPHRFVAVVDRRNALAFSFEVFGRFNLQFSASDTLSKCGGKNRAIDRR